MSEALLTSVPGWQEWFEGWSRDLLRHPLFVAVVGVVLSIGGHAAYDAWTDAPAIDSAPQNPAIEDVIDVPFAREQLDAAHEQDAGETVSTDGTGAAKPGEENLQP